MYRIKFYDQAGHTYNTNGETKRECVLSAIDQGMMVDIHNHPVNYSIDEKTWFDEQPFGYLRYKCHDIGWIADFINENGVVDDDKHDHTMLGTEIIDDIRKKYASAPIKDIAFEIFYIGYDGRGYEERGGDDGGRYGDLLYKTLVAILEERVK